MSPENSLLTTEEREALQHTMLVGSRLQEQFENLDQQHQTAVLGMWVFLATEVMFFGTLFLAVAVYRYLYPAAFECASAQLNWVIGGINTIVLLVSSLTIVLAVHYAQHGQRDRIVLFLALTAVLGACFLGLKAVEYYNDYRENLIPGWRFDADEWVTVRRAPRRPGAAREAVSLALLDHDRFSRPARDHRRRGRAGDARSRPAGPLLAGLLLAGRCHGALLAFRRHRVDLPASDAVLAQHAPPRAMNGQRMRTLCPNALFRPSLMSWST